MGIFRTTVQLFVAECLLCVFNLSQATGRAVGKVLELVVLNVIEEIETDEICHQLEFLPSSSRWRMHRTQLCLAECVGSQWLARSEENATE